MDLTALRAQLVASVIDLVETLTGEELLLVVTRDDDGALTARVPLPDAEILADVLNGWVDNTVWNAPKTL